MKALIVNIGDELLVGQTVNTNAAWMGCELNLIGIRVEKTEVVPDRKEAILEVLDYGKNFDVVLITGGLGPTKDDITKKIFASYFNVSLVLNPDVLGDVEEYFRKRGREISELNRQQALVPEGCRVVRNKNGTAPGMWMLKGNTHYISLPGVPYEMKAMMKDEILPALAEILEKSNNQKKIFHHTVLTIGIGESKLAEMLNSWEEKLYHHGFYLAYLPQPGMVRLRISHYDSDATTFQRVQMILEELRQIIPEFYAGDEKYGDEHLTIQKIIYSLCTRHRLSLSLAESCTGGTIASLITSVPGSSTFFRGSFVTYSNDSKTQLLGVPANLISEFGVVSEQCVRAMAEGCLKSMNTDLALAVSGIAGPLGGTPDKPVGTVWMAWANRDTISSCKFQLGDERERNITLSSVYALNELRKFILKNYGH